MEKISIKEAKMEASENVININSVIESDLIKIIEQIEKTGQSILIVRGNKPIVKIIPQKKNDPLETDPMLEGACFVGDPTEPLPDSDWPEELR
jgi:antitoxin (DNA-binding transcriptional repressor) of toxin-antitoxin stability system